LVPVAARRIFADPRIVQAEMGDGRQKDYGKIVQFAFVRGAGIELDDRKYTDLSLARWYGFRSRLDASGFVTFPIANVRLSCTFVREFCAAAGTGYERKAEARESF
jgi:hypothetical protein